MNHLCFHLPTSNLVHAPVSISLLTIVGLIGAFAMALALTKSRRRTYLYMEKSCWPPSFCWWRCLVIRNSIHRHRSGRAVGFIRVVTAIASLGWSAYSAKRKHTVLPQNRLSCMSDHESDHDR